MELEDEFTDEEDLDEPAYYEETPRVWHTTTRSGRRVFTAPKLVMEEIEYSDDDDESEGVPSSCDTPSTDATYTGFSDAEDDEDDECDEDSASSAGHLESCDESDSGSDGETLRECED